MPLLAIDHVQLAMPAGGEERARAFYAGLLGLEEHPKPPHLARRGGAWFAGPGPAGPDGPGAGVKVHLGVDADFRPARKAHAAFEVDDVAALRRRAEEGGWEVVDDEPLPGYDRIYLTDPFGNRLEFLAPLGR